MPTLQELRQRKLVQWALAYLAGAWLLLQVVMALAATFAWPPLVSRATTVLLAAGLPAALIVAWYHGEQGRQRISSVELAMLAGILVIAGVGVAWVRGPAVPAAGTVDALAAGAAVNALAAGAPVEDASIAVLPFADLSPAGDQEYFSDGISEELLNLLAQVPDLRVAARTSAFAFKEKEVGIDSIGRALRVAHVLEGSVRTAGDRVRITAQLIDARTGYHLWSETYDRELSDIFQVQDEIARAITARLQEELGVELAATGSTPAREVHPEAHSLVLRALHVSRARQSLAGDREAERMMDRAIELDPGYARAYALRAHNTLWQIFHGGLDREQALPRIQRDVRRALELDPTEASAHVVLGDVAQRLKRRPAEAEAHYRRALRYQPNHPEALHYLTYVHLARGELDEAIRLAEQLAQRDPVSVLAQRHLGLLYSLSGSSGGSVERMRKAVDQFRVGLELRPEDPSALTSLSFTLSFLGDHDQAIDAARRAAAADSGWLFALGHALGYAGRKEEARRVLARIEARGDTEPYRLANVYAVLGERERTIELLSRSVEQGGGGLLPVARTFAPYADDPRVQALIARVRGEGR